MAGTTLPTPLAVGLAVKTTLLPILAPRRPLLSANRTASEEQGDTSAVFAPLESPVPALEAYPKEGEEKLRAVNSPVAVLVELLHQCPELAGGELQAEHLTASHAQSKVNMLRLVDVRLSAKFYLDEIHADEGCQAEYLAQIKRRDYKDIAV